MRNRVIAVSVALLFTSILAAGLISGVISDETGYYALFQKCIATWLGPFGVGYIGACVAYIYTVLVPDNASLLNDVTVGLFVFFVLKTAIFIYLSQRHYRRKPRETAGNAEPFVSIIVPCYNEEQTVANCMHGLMKQTYDNYEVILVNDGSTDNTASICKELVAQYPEKMRFCDKPNGGKASALRFGIEQAKGEIIVTMDADSIFLRDALKNLVTSFDDPRVGAAGGNVRVANKDNFLGIHQAVEYMTGLAIQRRAFVQLNSMQVIAGAIGAFRKKVLLEIGGYDSDTLVEDMDITIKVLKAGYRVEYNGKAIAYTEAPANIRDFLKQRYRWTFGGFQVLKKHRSMLFNRKYGLAGIVGLPYFLLAPWIDVLFTMFFVVSVIRAAAYGGLTEFFLFYSCMMIVQGILVLYAIKIDGEDRKLILSSCTYGLWYNHLLSIVTLFAGIRYMSGASASWNKMARLGKNVLAED